MPKTVVKNRAAIKRRVKAEFKRLDDALERSNPGIVEMLQIYGDYEALARQTTDALSALNPKPIFSTSDRSLF